MRDSQSLHVTGGGRLVVVGIVVKREHHRHGQRLPSVSLMLSWGPSSELAVATCGCRQAGAHSPQVHG